MSQKKIEIIVSGPIDAVVRPPGSKSITNRALIIGAFAEGTTVLEGVLESEDTLIMFDALGKLGLETEYDRENFRMKIKGCSGLFPIKEAEIHVGNSGTTARFLAGALCFSDGKYRIHGKPRMHERPIGDLIFGLNQLGGSVRSENGNDCPPLLIEGIRGKSGLNDAAKHLGITSDMAGTNGRFAAIPGNVSSQFLSAMLLSGPIAASEGEVEIHVVDKLVSRPYIGMTLAMMNSFGVDVEVSTGSKRVLLSEGTSFIVQTGAKYLSRRYSIEPDASAASYFFAAAAVTGGKVTVEGLSENSLQGDIGFVYALRRMGCLLSFGANSTTVEAPRDGKLKGITIDMNEISDTVQTLSVVALFAEGSTVIKNVAHIRHKETDRISATAKELRKLGAEVREFSDGLEIRPSVDFRAAEIETYDDHRMAMSFSIAGLRIPGVVILDPDCVQKTYPKFFEEMGRIGNGVDSSSKNDC